ncbi:hypothetical protein MtrunA17_Chr3g0117401 [Medicago truncatula]|uniref:Transmembrane protein n=1 Tax=Medicago truncatula TaxID=3880 RepID=A0A396IWE8_MEDTR|nr:hypothetical protein MtrunA17_Chr3g0117401 [Medicago truncatula]
MVLFVGFMFSIKSDDLAKYDLPEVEFMILCLLFLVNAIFADASTITFLRIVSQFFFVGLSAHLVHQKKRRLLFRHPPNDN